jgi:hypothetical protein
MLGSVWTGECLVFRLKLVKYAMEQFIVMMYIALASRYKVLSKFHTVWQTVWNNNFDREVVLVPVNSFVYDKDFR